MTKQPMTPLRQRMIDDMSIRNMSSSTKKVYVYSVAKFSAFHGRSPDKLTVEFVRDYQLHLTSRGYQPPSINAIMAALRFFYGVTFGRKHVAGEIPYARTADRLPAVLALRDFKSPNPPVRHRQLSGRSKAHPSPPIAASIFPGPRCSSRRRL
jgi:hypothetical protein